MPFGERESQTCFGWNSLFLRFGVVLWFTEWVRPDLDGSAESPVYLFNAGFQRSQIAFPLSEVRLLSRRQESPSRVTFPQIGGITLEGGSGKASRLVAAMISQQLSGSEAILSLFRWTRASHPKKGVPRSRRRRGDGPKYLAQAGLGER